MTGEAEMEIAMQEILKCQVRQKQLHCFIIIILKKFYSLFFFSPFYSVLLFFLFFLQALVTYAVYVKNLATGYVTALNLKSAKSSAMDVCAMLF